MKQINKGNLQGKWFNHGSINDVMLPLATDVFNKFPILETVDLWYDDVQDFYHLSFTINDKLFDIRYYKAFSVTIDGHDGWYGCPRYEVVAFLNYIKQESAKEQLCASQIS